MKTLNKLRAASIATLAVAAVSLPTLAQATGNYRHYDASADCRAQENDARLAGGIIGAVVGGVVGSQVSGNGARTEGSAIGAVLGGLAGAGIGDESVDCDERRYDTRRGDGNYTNTAYRTTSPVVYRDSGFQTAAYDSYRRTYHRGNSYGYNDRYEYKNHGQWMKQKQRVRKELRRIEKRKYRVKADLKELHYNKRYMPRWEFKRIRSGLYEELEFLNRRERRLQNKLGYRNAGYRY